MIIEDHHFEYLVIQHGKVSDFRHDRKQWEDAYRASLAEIFESIKPALPVDCGSVLDIGSGLGGIDVLVAKHYDPQPHVMLVDGMKDPPIVKNSFTTFSNADVARDFHEKNGVHDAECHPTIPEMKYDLIHSYFSYGFHVHPGSYLIDVKKAMRKKTVCIFDVRRSKKEWLREFIEALGTPRVLHQAEKYVRLVFNG